MDVKPIVSVVEKRSGGGEVVQTEGGRESGGDWEQAARSSQRGSVIRMATRSEALPESS